MLTIETITMAAATIASEFPITRIVLFGSYAEGKETPKSDVDLMIEFTTDVVSLLTLAEVKHRIEDILEVPVDVIHAPIPEDALIFPRKVVELYAA